LHGIGGAKYDQVTDQIARQFFGFAPPEYATVPATLRLPIPHEPMDAALTRRLSQQAREMQFHPERYIFADPALASDGLSEMEDLITSKRRWVMTPKTAQNARERHVAITRANEELRSHLETLQMQVERQRNELVQRKRANAILESREYAFCLFPRRHFEHLLLDDPPLI
jgi:hypothetical protein